jgi:hypothetical protein
MVENSFMKKTTPAVPETATVMIRVPKWLHTEMLRRKDETGRSLQWQVLDLIKRSHEKNGKAART